MAGTFCKIGHHGSDNTTVIVRADEPQAGGTVSIGPCGLWRGITLTSAPAG
ncbi:hypothetical protein JOF48_003532 [Arthrobacter stackebrandtii]|uniref:Uncharacterized protein n=1 Tax=Arthrobacter stackebrandtii TaxID=272161 RepID=A0ABS4Z3A9_9MICC|nr:hypothetical protein [Arthrobacter stackebrandtii]MBP2414733.1 hypothetical protein [Arthrobacter stackebrandtii]